MASLPIPKPYKRLGPFSLDEDEVFYTQEALDAYLAGGSAYAGQVVALVLDSQNEALIYKVNKDLTLGNIGREDIDAAPIENSEKPLSSGGAFTALSNKVDKVAGKGLSTEDYTTDEQTKVANLPADTNTELGNKVDKVAGKGLSTNDYTTEEQTKVANLPADTNTELGNKVDKVTGKGLSTNDYTTEEQTKVANLPADTNTELGNKVDKVTGKGLSTEDYTTEEQTKVANLPADTNTELGNKVDKVTGKGLSTEDYTTEEQTKVANLPADTNTELGNKVDKVTGKVLSTEDYTTDEKNKVANIPADTNTELGNKVDKTTDIIEQYGSISDTTKNILLDNANWGNFDNEFIYVDQTPTELGLYPGLIILNISAKYRYECTENGVYRSIKAQPVSVLNTSIAASDGIGGTYELVVPSDIDKVLINLNVVNTGQSSWDIVNIKLPDTTVLVYHDMKVIYQSMHYSVVGTVVNIVNQNNNILVADLQVADIVDVVAYASLIKTRLWT